MTAIAAIAVVSWGINRGFDMMDEGFYCVAAQYPQRCLFPSSFGYLLHALPHLMGSVVIDLRLYNLLSRLVAAAALSFGFYQLIVAARQPRSLHIHPFLLILSIAVLGSFEIYSVLPSALSYNGLTCLFVDSAAGLFLSILADNLRSRRGETTTAIVTTFKAIAMGVLVGLCIFSKLTSFVAFVFVLASVAVWVLDRSFLLKTLFGATVGVCLAVITYGGCIQDLGICLHVTSAAYAMEASSGHQLSRVFDMQVSFLPRITTMASLLATLALLGALTIMLRHKPILSERVWLALGMSGLSGTLILTVLKPQFLLEHGNAFLYTALGSMIIAACIESKNVQLEFSDLDGHRRRALTASMLLLFLLPFCTSVGTDCGLLWHMRSNFAPFAILGGTAAFACLETRQRRIFAMASLCAFSLIMLTHVVGGYIFQPFRQSCGLLEQNVQATELTPGLTGVLLDRATASYLNRVANLLYASGFRKKSPLVAIADAPGLIYALDATPYASSWIPLHTLYIKRDIFAFKDAPRCSELFAAINCGSLPKHVLTVLNSSWFRFPLDFEEIGRIPTAHYYYTGSTTRLFRLRTVGAGKDPLVSHAVLEAN